MKVDLSKIRSEIENGWLSESQVKALKSIEGIVYTYQWQLYDSLSEITDNWKLMPETINNREFNKKLECRLDYIYKMLLVY